MTGKHTTSLIRAASPARGKDVDPAAGRGAAVDYTTLDHQHRPPNRPASHKRFPIVLFSIPKAVSTPPWRAAPLLRGKLSCPQLSAPAYLPKSSSFQLDCKIQPYLPNESHPSHFIPNLHLPSWRIPRQSRLPSPARG